MIRILFLAIVLLLSACGDAPVSTSQSFVFGTQIELSVYGVPDPEAQEAMADVLQEFQRLHDKLHPWQPSELNALNAAFATGKSMVISAELAAMIRDATQISQQSKGLFNPGVGSLIRLWGFHRDEFTPALPDQEQLTLSVKANPQMSDITLTPTTDGDFRASSRNFMLQLDLGGYAKGYALDRAAEILHKHGIRNALINIGGNVMALGKHGHRAWRVGIQHPRTSGALATIALHDGEAIGTSGDYQRYFMLNDVRYCHLIDPRTARPVNGVQAVSILTRGKHAGVLSDAASKPLFISGAQGWRAAATQMNLSEAMLIDAQGQVHMTKALAKRLEFTDKHTVRKVE